MNAQIAPAPTRFSTVRLALAILFVVLSTGYVWWQFGHISLTLVVAAAFGAYMAMNIGANDVANNVGPAVGSKVLTLGGALLIAAGRRCLAVAQEVGGLALLIDAKSDRAAQWYEGFGALRLEDAPLSLVLPLGIIAQAMAGG